MNLKDLTGQEAGIIIYGNNFITVANWNGLDGLPLLFPTGTIGSLADAPVALLKVTQVSDVTALLPQSYEVISDPNGDLDHLSGPGTVYTLPDGIVVIAPEGWN